MPLLHAAPDMTAPSAYVTTFASRFSAAAWTWLDAHLSRPTTDAFELRVANVPGDRRLGDGRRTIFAFQQVEFSQWLRRPIPNR